MSQQEIIDQLQAELQHALTGYVGDELTPRQLENIGTAMENVLKLNRPQIEVQASAGDDNSISLLITFKPPVKMQRITNDQYVTPEQAAEDKKTRDLLDEELPELIARQHERDYLRGLEDGERVIETGDSGMKGRTGTVCRSTVHPGLPAVIWDNHPRWVGPHRPVYPEMATDSVIGSYRHPADGYYRLDAYEGSLGLRWRQPVEASEDAAAAAQHMLTSGVTHGTRRIKEKDATD